MAKQPIKPPLGRDSRRQFLIRSAKLGAGGLPLIATLHHRSALANTVCLTNSAASSMDVSGRDVFNPNDCNKGASIAEYDSGAVAFPPGIASNIKVSEFLNGMIGVQSTVNYDNKQVKLMFSDYLGGNTTLEVEALAVQTWFNAKRAESVTFDSYALAPEFAEVLIRELFDGGGTTIHNLSPFGSVIELFRGINN